MRVLRYTGDEIHDGDPLTDQMGRQWTYRNVSDLPNSGGRQWAGRVLVEDPEGNKDYLYPFEVSLSIVMSE